MHCRIPARHRRNPESRRYSHCGRCQIRREQTDLSGHAQIRCYTGPRAGEIITIAEFFRISHRYWSWIRPERHELRSDVYVDRHLRRQGGLVSVGGGSTVTAEMHIVARAFAVSSVHFFYIADTYSNRFALETSRKTFSSPTGKTNCNPGKCSRIPLKRQRLSERRQHHSAHGPADAYAGGRKTADRDTCICFSSVSLG
jgi:hypothetical protein